MYNNIFFLNKRKQKYRIKKKIHEENNREESVYIYIKREKEEKENLGIIMAEGRKNTWSHMQEL